MSGRAARRSRYAKAMIYIMARALRIPWRTITKDLSDWRRPKYSSAAFDMKVAAAWEGLRPVDRDVAVRASETHLGRWLASLLQVVK